MEALRTLLNGWTTKHRMHDTSRTCCTVLAETFGMKHEPLNARMELSSPLWGIAASDSAGGNRGHPLPHDRGQQLWPDRGPDSS